MKVIINFNIRNPDWYWSNEQIKEAKGYYEEWKFLNEDKVPKHTPTWAYEVGFDVIEVKENREASYKIIHENTERLIEDVTLVTFIGENEKANIVVANSLIHSYLGAKNSGGKYYWYFFIKDDAKYVRLGDFVWVAAKK